jgi:hypothetical protein
MYTMVLAKNSGLNYIIVEMSVVDPNRDPVPLNVKILFSRIFQFAVQILKIMTL